MGTGQADPCEYASHRLSAEVDALPFPQEFGEVSVIGAWVVSPGQVNDSRSQLIWDSIARLASPMATGQSGSSLLVISRQNAPGVALGDAHRLGCLVHRKPVFQHVVQYL